MLCAQVKRCERDARLVPALVEQHEKLQAVLIKWERQSHEAKLTKDFDKSVTLVRQFRVEAATMLQKAALVHERALFSVDLLRAFRSPGARR